MNRFPFIGKCDFTNNEVSMFTEIKVNTTKSECLVNITEQVQQAIAESKVQEGIC